MQKHAGVLIGLFTAFWGAILAVLLVVFDGSISVPGWAIGLTFIGSSLFAASSSFLVGRYLFPSYALRADDEIASQAVSTTPHGDDEQSNPGLLTFASGLKRTAKELIRTKPYMLHVTKDGLYENYIKFEIEHCGVLWECWAGWNQELLGVDAPPLCLECRTQLVDEDAKNWRCPNPACNAVYRKPAVTRDPAEEASKIFMGKLRRGEIARDDATHIGVNF